MTQREFAEMTGTDMAADGFMDKYAMANAAYMAAGELGKEAFCKDYRRCGLTATVCALTEEVEKKTRRADSLAAKIDEAARKLIDMASELEDDEAGDAVYEQAVALIGRKEAVKYSIEKGYGLNKGDYDFLLELLSE